MKAKAYTAAGTARSGDYELPGDLFDGTVNEAVLHQVVTAIQANKRQGTHSTKTRQTIRGGGAKPWRQKGTGRARQGSIRSAQWRGGVVVFGPQPRSYRLQVPKGIRQLAIRSALNARAMDGSVVVIEPLSLDAPKTRTIVDLLDSLDASGNVVILTDGLKKDVYLSSRNLQGVLVRPWGEASAYDLIWSDLLIIEETAFQSAAEESPEEER
ncbi:MAG: 50S ribosomal protein L4 [marine benthic group bacterium]|jgi:large subunit ribosomal protein L4|nr:50S ribosomal protein L4 [Candidatus Carthagonibacter metallireducens]MCL7964015.1 50S ribosomal protein L4 [Gemmatimonadota bacterium]MCL7967221.1 50S ribosomal protein L4 [Gemmatimonadota bacterium]MCL7969694.1 50S ribosomal protein L4 [Gemmatimonadota bacterium]MCL7975396.1 50S ribosomal protein L4 [Gemmatimonadota bacterium]